MSLSLQNVPKLWRGGVLLVLFAISFHKGWDWIFWVGLILLTITDPATYQKQPAVPRRIGALLVLGYLLIMTTAVVIYSWELIHLAPVSVWSLVLIVSAVAAVLLAGIASILKAKGKKEPQGASKS